MIDGKSEVRKWGIDRICQRDLDDDTIQGTYAFYAGCEL